LIKNKIYDIIKTQKGTTERLSLVMLDYVK